jgi:hypothetical protein
MRFLLIFFLLLHASFLSAAGEIGRVIALQGIVKAINPNQVERVLEKGGDIFLQETIITSEKAKGQIRFTDGGVVNLIASTEFRVDEYRFNEKGQKDRFLGNLLKGGFRILSGSAAKKNPEGYQIQTPNATIGLRGTIIEVLFKGSKTYVGITQGRALVANESGAELIGQGTKAQFAMIPSDAPPQVLASRPSELKIQTFAPPSGGANIDQLQTRQTSKLFTPTPTAPESPSSGTSSTSTSSSSTTTTESTSSSSSTTEGTTTTTEGTSSSTEGTSTTEGTSSTTSDGTSSSTSTTTSDTSSEPTIGDTTSPSDFDFQQTGGGGGGSIQSGC